MTRNEEILAVNFKYWDNPKTRAAAEAVRLKNSKKLKEIEDARLETLRKYQTTKPRAIKRT